MYHVYKTFAYAGSPMLFPYAGSPMLFPTKRVFRSVRQQGIAVASEVPKIVFELLGHIYIYKHAILYIYPVENEHGTSKPLVWSLENSL